MLLVKPLCLLGLFGLIVALLVRVTADYASGVPQAFDAGHLFVDGRFVQLAGVDAPAKEQPCRFAGTTWLCGLRAGRELAGWLGDRPIRCLPTVRLPTGWILGRCYRGVQDVGNWVVEQGWALANFQESGRYASVENKARARLAGLWRSQFEIPRLWRLRHKTVSNVVSSDSVVRPQMSDSMETWHWVLPVFGLVLCMGMGLQWWGRLNGPPTASHRWRIQRSHQLLRKLRDIGRERGPAAQFAYLRKVDPWVVEELVLTAIERQGHVIRRNRHYTGDGGIDGRCWIDRRLTLVQVKRYGSRISADHVRALAALCLEQNARGLFVHTGKTGASASASAGDVVEIVSGARLLRLLGVAHTQLVSEFADAGDRREGSEPAETSPE